MLRYAVKLMRIYYVFNCESLLFEVLIVLVAHYAAGFSVCPQKRLLRWHFVDTTLNPLEMDILIQIINP